MSLKEQGNQYFRQGIYPEAIRCYQQYIDYDPQADKKVAYTNISFCQYKLGQYHQSIESANDAIAEDSTYKKAYYRRIMAYKELPNSEYEVFVNIHLLLKYSDTMDEKEKYDYRRQMKEWKERWIHKRKVEEEGKKIEQLIFDDGVEGEVKKQEKSIEQWLQQWSAPHSSVDQHWKQIQLLAKEDVSYAINVAYLLLNQLKSSQSQYFVLKDKIKKLEGSINRMDIQEDSPSKEILDVPVKESKKSSSSDDNLFDLSDHSAEIVKDTIKTSVQPKQEKITKEKTQGKTPAEMMHVQMSKKQVKQQKNDLIKPSEEIKTQTVKPDSQDYDSVYKGYVNSLSSSSRDEMADLSALVEIILSSAHPRSTKQRLLTEIKKDYSKLVQLMKKSFTKGQQKKVFQLLQSNQMRQFIPDFASKHVQ